jgi:hypothetical protein
MVTRELIKRRRRKIPELFDELKFRHHTVTETKMRRDTLSQLLSLDIIPCLSLISYALLKSPYLILKDSYKKLLNNTTVLNAMTLIRFFEYSLHLLVLVVK